MKLAGKMLSFCLVLIMIVSVVNGLGFISADAATQPSFSIDAVSGLSNNNAQINAWVNNPSQLKITKVGFQIGTKSGSWTVTKNEPISMTSKKFKVFYLMSKWYGKLKADTTYYYRFFLTTGGKNIYSSVKSFKTLSNTPTFTIQKVTSLSYNNAQIRATINNPLKQKITKVGFQIGLKSGSWNATKSESINKSNTFDAFYLMSKWYGSLNADTRYYYRFFITTGGKNVYSSVSSFKTPSKPKYAKINSLSISRIIQPKNDSTGSCYLASVATLYGYKNNKGSLRSKGLNYSQSCAVYKEVYKINGNTTFVYDATITKLGLKLQGYSLANVYNSLKAGKPVVVYSGKHASLVIGYKGNNAPSLKESDFIVMEINAGWKNNTTLYDKFANTGEDPYKWDSCYMTLDKWSSYTYRGSTTGKPIKMVTY